MSKIICKCGNILSDSTDNLPYKGYIISDKERFKMYDLVDELIETDNTQKESLIDDVSQKCFYRKKLYSIKRSISMSTMWKDSY